MTLLKVFLYPALKGDNVLNKLGLTTKCAYFSISVLKLRSVSFLLIDSINYLDGLLRVLRVMICNNSYMTETF